MFDPFHFTIHGVEEFLPSTFLALERGPPPKFLEISSPTTTSSSSPPEMARRTRSHAQHFDLPPAAVNPFQEQGGQQDLNSLHAEEVPEHRPGKDSMIVAADDDANLGELTRRTERLKDVIRAIQMTVNQLNQFLLRATGQGINSSQLRQDLLNKPWPSPWGKQGSGASR